MGSAPLYLQKQAPARDAADAYIDQTLAKSIAALDANNAIYYWDASRNYDPSGRLGRIKAPIMWINSADDYINPPELGIAEKLVTQIPRGKFVLIPISDATRGHGTHTEAAVWKQYLIQLLAESERKG